jgi:hypothetical protein
MSHRLLVLLIALAFGVSFVSDLAISQQDKRIESPPDKADKIRIARERARNWSKMGMWLPATDVPFFNANFPDVQSVLANAIGDSNDDIRQRAAFVISELGSVARPLEPVVIQRIEKEPSRLVRMYLYGAARSMRATTEKMRMTLKARFAALETEPDVRAKASEYTPIDERIEIASALLMVDDSKSKKADYLDYVLRWLKPIPTGLPAGKREDYWDHRWMAVTVIENAGEPRDAIPLLEAMVKEPGAKPWVQIKVLRALTALKPESRSNPGKPPADK